MNVEPQRLMMGHVPVDVVDFDGAIARVLDLCEERRGGTVFTPNVDHVVRAETDLSFRKAYADASLSLVDGMPIVWASRLWEQRLPERITGSRLFEPLVAAASERALKIYFLGGRENAGNLAKEALLKRIPELQIVGIGPRTRDILQDPDKLREAGDEIKRLRPDIAFVALGSPIQEVWSAEMREALAPTVLIGVGSALDLIAGLVDGPPAWVGDMGFEWLFRLASEPQRLWRRYVLGAPRFAYVVAKHVAKK